MSPGKREGALVTRAPEVPDEPLLTRRGVLAGLCGGLVLFARARVSRALAPGDLETPRVPGERIRVFWPPLVDPSQARVWVLRDGHVVGEAPLHVPAGRWWRFLEVEALPPAPILPGRYDFALAVGPFRLPLGGFRIAPFWFGC